MRRLSTWILHWLGWKYSGHEQLDKLPKYLLAVAPHTSNWDFPLGILLRKSAGLDKVKFLGKSSLFKPPFGWLFRLLGGFPVQRDRSTNLVESYVDIFNRFQEFAIVIAPEGTRKKVDHFKTGFYYIAKGANIPIIPCVFDYEHRECRYLNPFYCTDNAAADLAYLEGLFRGVKGKNPELGIN
ncbi:MAG: 1-acyl-sn-glycerol-3-phosphate acyltransferase [Saprospiraceae bacterium]